MIVMDTVSKRFDDTAVVDQVSLAVPAGSIYGFIGPSGSGKTTVIRLLTGVYEPSEGELRVLGIPPERWGPSQREQVGYMPQLFVLYPNLSVNENLDFAASIYGLGWWTRQRRKRDLLRFVELWEHRHKLARSISGGMQRRLALACALIHNPPLMFLDEPTAGIDPVLRSTIWDHLKELRDQGKTLFVTTQYVTEAEYCDRVGLIHEGRLIANGTPDELRRLAFGGQMLRLTTSVLNYNLLARIEALPLVVNGSIERVSRDTAQLAVEDAGTAIPQILRTLDEAGVPMEAVRISEENAPFDDVFVRLINQDREATTSLDMEVDAYAPAA